MGKLNITSSVKRTIYRLLQSQIERSARDQKGLDLSLWEAAVDHHHHLIMGGCDCTRLAADHGTPLFVVDEKKIRKNFQAFHGALTAHGIEQGIYYSYKTNPVPAILRVLHDCGAGAEVISPYELWLALKLGVPPDRIIYNGPNKSVEGLQTAIDHGIKLININSLSEIDHIERLAAGSGKTACVGVRVSPGVGWGAQFGLKLENGEALAAFRKMAGCPHIDPQAIHFHLGTNLQNAHLYQSALAHGFELLQAIQSDLGLHLRYLDLGGGFGVPTVRALENRESKLNTFFYKPYRPPCVEEIKPVSRIIDDLVATFQALCLRFRIDPPALLFEPGRSLTSNAEILLTRVGDLKTTAHGFPIALLDAGINIARPLTFEYHEIFVANRMAAPANQRCGLAGPICTPMDFFLKSKKLPLLQAGDLLAIMDAGAYFTSFANDFSLPRPAIVMALDGSHRLIRKKESYDDLIRLDDYR